MSEKNRKLIPSRERVTTIADDGSRNFLRPADVRGRFTVWRRVVAVVLIVIYAALPWIQIKGQPAVFLDVIGRRFHFMGVTLAVEDLWFVFFLITGLGFALFFITALFGRLWCGWACPQTVFLEHVFRRIERWIEGPASAQKALDNKPWDTNKVLRRGSKHLIFILFSALVAHIFLSYFISVETLFSWVREGPMAHPRTFVFVVAVTVVLYFNFSWFREQLCLIICPYGRLQSALIDDDTVVIGYDEVRGEPRGRPGVEGVGDCIACNRCVQVCPTGIDIRQGLQMECIACSNCVDACDEVMTKVNRPKGLIRYDSLRVLQGGERKFLRPRLFLYLVLLLFGVSAMALSWAQLSSTNLSVTRMAGNPYFLGEDNIRNQLMVRITNKSHRQEYFHLYAEKDGRRLASSGFSEAVAVEPFGEVRGPFVVLIPLEEYEGPGVISIVAENQEGDQKVRRSFRFFGPSPELLFREVGSEANSAPSLQIQ